MGPLLSLALALAAASPDRIAIVADLVEGESEGSAITSAQIRASAERALAFAPMVQTAVDDGGPSGVEALLRACGSDVECGQRVLSKAGLRFGLLILVSTTVRPALVTAELVDVTSGPMLAAIARELDGGPPALDGLLFKLVLDVLERGRLTVGGRLNVEVSPPNARVLLTPSPPNTHFGSKPVLPVGEYALRVEAEGFDAWEGRAEVTRGEETRLAVQLASQNMILESPILWIGVGAVVLAGGIAALVLLQGDSPSTICHAPSAELCR